MITIALNPNDLAKVNRLLGDMKNAVPKVLVRSLNKTLTGVKTDASTAIRAVINAKKATVDASFRTVNATAAILTAHFESKGKPLPLIEFSARQTQQGVSVQVLKNTPRTVVAGAFIQTIQRSGHKGVFWRVWHGAKQPKRKLAYGKLPAKFRLPIKERFGPRVPDILSNEPVMQTVLTKANERLHTNIEHELNYELMRM